MISTEFQEKTIIKLSSPSQIYSIMIHSGTRIFIFNLSVPSHDVTVQIGTQLPWLKLGTLRNKKISWH
jgi:hypothetical protein